MLKKDPLDRYDVASCVNHPFFLEIERDSSLDIEKSLGVGHNKRELFASLTLIEHIFTYHNFLQASSQLF